MTDEGGAPRQGARDDRDEEEEHSFATGADGTRLFVRRRRGDHDPAGVTPFLCDGILCDGFIWKYLWPALGERYPLVHWHYRGHGRSGVPVDPDFVDIAAHASDLAKVRAHVGDPPAVLFGHSMGTQVCLEGYHRDPDRVRGLVLICGSFGKVTQSFRGVPLLGLLLPRITDAVAKQPDVARAIWQRIPPEMAMKMAIRAKDIGENVRSEDMLPYLKHMTHVDLPMFLKMLRGAGEHSAEDYLASIRVPVLIIAGEADTFTPASLSKFMQATIPDAELFTVPGGTHVVPIEQPERVAEKILSFMERVRSVSAGRSPPGDPPGS